MPDHRTPASGRTRRLIGAGARTLGRNLLNRLPVGSRLEREARYWAQVGEDWAQTLGELRGAAMKLGQMASQYSDLFPEAFRDKLAKLQRSVEPLPFEAVRPLLDAAWTPEQRKRLTRIEHAAFAAASIGQVHRARLDDDRRVVIKVRYPGVHEAVNADVSQLRRLLGLSRLLPKVDDSAIDAVLEEVRARFIEETDYTRELDNLRLLRQQAAPGIAYPEPIEALCTEGVLVLTEERGEPLETARTWPEATRTAIGSHLLGWLTRGIFLDAAVHADPHPGNFAFRPDGTVVVYDYGCVKRLSETMPAQLHALTAEAVAGDWAALHARLATLGGVASTRDAERLQPLYAELVPLLLRPVTDGDTFDFRDRHYIPDIRNCIRSRLGEAFRFKPISELVFVSRALSGLYWMLRGLDATVPVRRVLADNGALTR